MGAIKLGLGPLAVTRQAPAWMSPFQLALDFRAGRYQLNRQQVGLSRIDSLYHSRASARRAEDGQGVSHEYGNGVMAVTDRGYDSREGWNNLIVNPLGTGAVVGVVNNTSTWPTGWNVNTTSSGLTTEILEVLTYRGVPALRLRVFGTFQSFWELRIGGEITSGISENTLYSASAIVAERNIVAGPRAPSFEVSWRDAATSAHVGANSLLSGSAAEFGSSAVSESRRITVTSPTGTARARLRFTSSGLVEGTYYDCNFILAAPQLTQAAYPMPFGVGTVAPDALVIPAADAGLAINPATTGLTMLWRGVASPGMGLGYILEIGDATLGQSDTSSRMSFVRLTDGRIEHSRTNSSGTSGNWSSTPGTDGEFTALAVWRADGSRWFRAGSAAVRTDPAASLPMFAAPPSVIGIGNTRSGGGRLNGSTRLVAVGAFALPDADALNLFNAVAAA